MLPLEWGIIIKNPLLNYTSWGTLLYEEPPESCSDVSISTQLPVEVDDYEVDDYEVDDVHSQNVSADLSPSNISIYAWLIYQMLLAEHHTYTA